MEIMDSGMHIDNEKLYAYAAAQAKLLRPDGLCTGRAAAAALRRDYATLRRCHELLERRYGALAAAPSAVAWVLDNWYMVQRDYRSALPALQKARRLQCRGTDTLLTELSRALLRAGQGRADEERCELFLAGFQSVTQLSRHELLLFPAALRAAVLAELRRLCDGLLAASDLETPAEGLGALFAVLRWLNTADVTAMLRRADPIAAIFAADEVFSRMDEQSCEQYLARLERLALKEGRDESSCARALIERAQSEGVTLGALLFDDDTKGSGLYIAANLLLTLFFSLLLALALERAALALLLVLPVSELIKRAIDAVMLRLIAPRRLLRLDLSEGIPEEGKTICVISALLADERSGTKLARRLEELALSHRGAGEQLLFGLLADLPASSSETDGNDERLLAPARAAIEDLNRRYGGRFYLLTRPRVFDGERWTADERKRGALLALARLLGGEENALTVFGDRAALAGTNYILTLDSDTLVYPGAIRELIGTMLHPLNRPVVDEARGVVCTGYGLLHPRMTTVLSSANETDFALIFAGPGGSDPYGALCGENTMNAFASGGFSGKGLIDARALLRCCGDLPKGQILSHDALEGAYLRGGFVGDVEFADRFPSRPLAYFRRLHRWVRGDWQNLRWIGEGRLRDIDRWRLFDSLRRSLLMPMTLLAIVLGFLLPRAGLDLAAWAALLALASQLLLSLAERAGRRREMPRLRRWARLLTGVGGAIVQSFMRLWLLPWEAWICASAIATSLWRMAVSHKKLLEWETAAQSEQRSNRLISYARSMWFALLIGLICLIFSPGILGKAAGLMWLLSPAAALALALPAHREQTLSEAQREWLAARAGDTWRYFTSFSTAEDNYLPPDNVQVQPPKGSAHRTSPTNIGLAAASAAAACDLGLIPAAQAMDYLRRITDTLERMPKALGHLYNWYDTRTLLPLHPPMISTVDSGNLYAGLLTARVFLSEQGDASTAARLGAILDGMDFAPLYDKKRGLFYICYDTAEGRGSGGWYDLMASECMLTSYLAIAKGDVPAKHWRQLSRAQLQKDGFRGLASWSGSMFEYLMPFLFLPLPPGSMLHESARFCVYAQKRWGGIDKPWGVSESAWFSLDRDLVYRYRAHGVPELALQRGVENELVFAPYAAFLALCVQPEAAVRDLKRFERCGALGRWGFWEALDFTPERCRDPKGEKVQCTMAHHAAMSLLAAANALCKGSIVRRFFSSREMAAHALLLEEQLGDGAVLRREVRPERERGERLSAGHWSAQGERGETGLTALSNGSYHLLAFTDGRAEGSLPGLLPYDGSLELRLDGRGFTPARWTLGEDSAVYETDTASLTLTVAPGEWGELRQLRLRGERGERVSVRLSLRPVLARAEDYRAHPAFWRLGLWAEESEGALLLRRLARGTLGERWLCLLPSSPMAFSADERGGLGQLAHPLLTAEGTIPLDSRGEGALSVALCIGLSHDEALDGARRMLADGGRSRGCMLSAAATLLGLSAAEIGESLLSAYRMHAFAPIGAAPKRELWPYAISGELPILCCDGEARERDALLKRFLLLKSVGLDGDLVYLSDQGGDYRQPLRRRIERELGRRGLEALLGVSGGVHILPTAARPLLEGRCAETVGDAQPLLPPLKHTALSAPRRGGVLPPWRFAGHSFLFEAGDRLPPAPWQHMLTNGRLSAVVTELGPAALWWQNAREMPITAPQSLPEQTETMEQLWLETLGSLFAANDGLACSVRYAPGMAVWKKDFGARSVKTTLFIPPEHDFRILMLEGAEGLTLHWKLRFAGHGAASCQTEDGILVYTDKESPWPTLRVLGGSDRPMLCIGDYAPAAFEATVRCAHTTVLAIGCGSEEALRDCCEASLALSFLSETVRHWTQRLEALEITTGMAALDHYMNTWGPYQALACRIMARGSLYQAGGAWGFRDQLQDAVNLLLLDPTLAREQILRCCRHQYAEGDVMHWWHPLPEGDRGLRSRCSDDMLWLVWALCDTVERSGDEALCHERALYLASPVLRADERDRYETASWGDEGTVLDHARRALDLALERPRGRHGLPLFLSGDWNDGLDAIEGESLWLGWFLGGCARRFAALLERLGEDGAERCRQAADELAAACERGFTGSHYVRGFWRGDDPNRIDSIAQSWAVLSGLGDDAHTGLALNAAWARLYDREHGLVKLCAPPYTGGEGYLTGYGPGYRENGGQYTHGAIWLAMALLRRADRERGEELLQALLPETRDGLRYGAEPYVLPADVSAAPGHEGEAGWTWYTGSAGWYFRAVTEDLLGLHLVNGELTVRPTLGDYTARWRDSRGREYTVSVVRGKASVTSGKMPPEGLPKGGKL